MFMLENHGLIFDAARQPPEGRIAYLHVAVSAAIGGDPVRLSERSRETRPHEHHPPVPLDGRRPIVGAAAGPVRDARGRRSRFLGCGRTGRSRAGATAAVRHVV